MFTIKERRALDETEGWLWVEEGLRLAELAAQVPKTHWIVELGSHLGRSSGYLAAGSRAGRGARLVCIDTWGGEDRLENFVANMERLAHRQRFVSIIASLHTEKPDPAKQP